MSLSFTSLSLNAAESINTELDVVDVELKWKHAFQFAGYYAAIEKGFYREAGLRVLLHENEGGSSPIQTLLEGNADYAIGGSEVVLHRSEGRPIVVLGAIFQHSPYAFLVTDESGIKGAEDFAGQRLMILDDVQNAALLATLRRAGIGEDDYIHTPNTFDAFSLVRDEADVFSAYVSDQGFSLDEAGIKNHYILPEQYGIDFYGDVLVTSEGKIANDPDQVQGFLEATLAGWEYSLRHPEEIIDLILEKYNTQNLSREHLQYEANVSRELIQPILVKIGYTNPARWEHIKSVFVELGFLDSSSDMTGLVYQQQQESRSNLQWLIAHWYLLAGIVVATFVVALIIFTIQLRRIVFKRTEELMSREQDWRALINAEPACVKTINRQGEVLGMNLAGLKMLGVESEEQVLGSKVTDFADESYRQVYAELLEKGFQGESGDLLFKGKDLSGQEIWFEVYIVPFPELNGEVTRLLGLTHDVTERVESGKEKEILQYELQAARKMEALGHLTGGIAHDFNNLLAIIIGYSGLAHLEKDASDNSVLFEYIERIEDAGGRAKGLIDQMLIFSRGDDAQKISVKLNELIEKDLKILSAALPSSIKIDAEIKELLPAVNLNPGQFNQILMNLSINARDAMEGKGVLSIRLRLLKDTDKTCSACRKTVQRDWVELSIADTGSGIDAATLERMFDPFFTTKKVGEGSGMGLAVVYGIIHKNGGHVLVETQEGVGTTFKVLFPPLVKNELAQQIQHTGAVSLPSGNNETVLIVDDEKSYGEFVETLLNRNGYQAHFVNDSRKALQLFEENPAHYALLVTDQTMPELTGVELVEKVRQLSPNFPVVICSGYSEHFDSLRAQEMQVGYMAKPVDTNKLLIMIHDILS